MFWKIKTMFLFGLIAVSLSAYAILVIIYFTFIKKLEDDTNFFTTSEIPVILNPVIVGFIVFCIIVIMFLHHHGKL